MTPTYTIGEAARRSGFAPATLRYYDDLGLVTPAERSRAGYRRYDDRDLDRLRFIGRAKQLGCSLDEIGGLLVAWDGGECGPVQDLLRELVATKIDDSQDRLFGLSVLLAELQRAATDLERHRPSGSCDELCGCLIEPVGVATPTAVMLGRKPLGAPDAPPIACTLAPEAMPERLAAFRRFASSVSARRRLDRGVRLEFDDIDVATLAALVRHEQQCCEFWEFAITIDMRGVGLEVRGPHGSADLIDALFGVAA
jgi:MerR family transcriptional regulator, copper efflux regulator